jgi:hypothetical protein
MTFLTDVLLMQNARFDDFSVSRAVNYIIYIFFNDDRVFIQSLSLNLACPVKNIRHGTRLLRCIMAS